MAVESLKRSMSAVGMSTRTFVLVALTLQSSIHILVMHYSRTMPLVNGQRYFPSTAVFLNEVIKLAVCLTMALYDIATTSKGADTSTATALFTELGRAMFTGDSWKLAIPAMLFTLQNSLQYIAIGNLDAATFQVTSQLKILSTALFSVALLGRTLSGRRWLSLLLLMAGIAIVHLPGSDSNGTTIRGLRRSLSFGAARNTQHMTATPAGQLLKRSATYEGIDEDFAAANPDMYPTFGFSVLATACFISGLASVYFEKILKEPRTEYANSVWIRNVQLSFYSLWPTLFIGVIFSDGEHIAKNGFFAGYNWVVWAAILLQASGGILVAFAMKHADNIAKNFATSISILLSFLASVFFFGFEITTLYLCGTAAVLSATYLYTTAPDDDRSKTPQIRVAEPDREKHDASYFDIASAGPPAKSPMRGEALSTSRPGTPTIERVPHKLKSPDSRHVKREQ